MNPERGSKTVVFLVSRPRAYRFVLNGRFNWVDAIGRFLTKPVNLLLPVDAGRPNKHSSFKRT